MHGTASSAVHPLRLRLQRADKAIERLSAEERLRGLEYLQWESALLAHRIAIPMHAELHRQSGSVARTDVLRLARIVFLSHSRYKWWKVGSAEQYFALHKEERVAHAICVFSHEKEIFYEISSDTFDILVPFTSAACVGEVLAKRERDLGLKKELGLRILNNAFGAGLLVKHQAGSA